MRTDADRFADALRVANDLKRVTDVLLSVDICVRSGFHPYDGGVGSRLVRQLITFHQAHPDMTLQWPEDVRFGRELAGDATGAFPPFIGRPIDITENP